MKLVRIIVTLALSLFSSSIITKVNAVAPTDEAVAKWKAEGTYEKKVADWKAFKALGGCVPSERSVFDKTKFSGNMSAGAVIDTASVLVILVDFSDHPWDSTTHNQTKDATPQQFDSILFSNRDVDPVFNPTGSMTDFYLENSYGNFYVIGGITNWLRMPQTYAYYVNNANGLPPTGRGDELARDAVLAANGGGIDFNNFDHDNDGVIDGLVVIHAGHGAETGYYGIWSHKHVLPATLFPDGIEVSDYTMNPEESGSSIAPIGVICHEFGHFLGLPDLYDTDYDPPTSDGLGRWSLMASGNYNGNGQRPAHFDAWCKDQIGFLNLTSVAANLNNITFPAAEYSPVAYKLQNAASQAEYWVVENRQRIGFDFNLPHSGLLIYHVDPSAPPNNTNYLRYYVALEQADGNNDLALTLNNTGDAGDPYPGNTGNREFHDLSLPSDVVNFNSSVYPHIGVWEISNSDSIMYADLDVSWSRPYIVNDSIRFSDAIGGNNDGNLDPGETIRVFLTARNLMRTGFNARAQLATSNPDVNISTNNVVFDPTFDAVSANNNSVPIIFSLDDSTQTTLDSFYLTITCDSLNGTSGAGLNYSKTFGFEIALGTPRILIVDDDRGQAFDDTLIDVFSRNGIPTNVWHIVPNGIPTIGTLQKYPIVFWHTGDSALNVIDTADIARMKAYMDLGNSLFLSTMSGIRDMHVRDSSFLHNYFKATYTGQTGANDCRGVPGSALGNSSRYRAVFVAPYDDERQTMAPVTGGESFLSHVLNQPLPSCGISYGGTYKSVLISFPFESIQDNAGGSFRPKDTLLHRVLNFFNDFSTGIGDGPLDNLPKSFVLEQNYPNPFNPSTTISYSIHSRGSSEDPNRTLLEIYNLLGQKVRTLVDEAQSPGLYSIEWAGNNDAGKKVSSGIYFYRLVLGAESQTKKMMLVK